MNLKLAVIIAMGTVGYIAWGLLAYFVDRSQMGGFIAINISMVSGTIGLALRDLQYPNEPPSPPPAPAVAAPPAPTTNPQP